MKKTKTAYVCDACGGKSLRWAGQCPDCGAWNTLTETQVLGTQRAAAPEVSGGPTLLESLGEAGSQETPRFPTGLDELDRVLGGGLVPGSITLIGGDPGIGKSTLLLQATASLAQGRSVLYVSGEESLSQVGLRAKRLEVGDAPVTLAAETCVEQILEAAHKAKPGVLVVDSIQTVFTATLQSAPGAVAQLRECTALFTRYAKQSGTAVFLVGHVTKEGVIAGPRVLEHMVDTVLYFEGDTHSSFRLIRAIKNRFGAVNEIGVFAMTEKGLKGVSNPSAIFLSQHAEPVPGSCVMVTLEGTRPMLVEIQALVDSGGPSPRRLSVGLDRDRLAMLLAVLHRHAGVACLDQDVFVNAVGGVRISEPAADLAVMLAIQGSLRARPLP
ncbi:MAG TPA: DNA repair protein RadA, partial [Gammaproteobacteria bacterium]|nr:DNA repair protein RadA [Gammaproteobacteria bacterium]